MASLGISEADRGAIERFQREVIEPSMTSLVVLQFTAEWCGPCKQLSPILDKIGADYAEKGVLLARIDVDSERMIAEQFRIQSVPTVYALFQGQPVADLTAHRTEAQLARALDQLLGQLPIQGAAQELASQVEPLIATGEEMLAQSNAAGAESIFSQLTEMDPSNPAVIGGLARAIIAGGRPDDARALLDSTKADPSHPALSRARAALNLATTPAVDVSAELARIAANPDDHEARLAIANAAMAAGDQDAAADALLEIIARDRDWNEGAARARLLQLLEASGLDDPWARSQRRRLSALLFT